MNDHEVSVSLGLRASQALLLAGTRPPSTDPKMVVRNMGFVGAGVFVLGVRQGEIFLFGPMCLYSKYSEFCGEVKNV